MADDDDDASGVVAVTFALLQAPSEGFASGSGPLDEGAFSHLSLGMTLHPATLVVEALAEKGQAAARGVKLGWRVNHVGGTLVADGDGFRAALGGCRDDAMEALEEWWQRAAEAGNGGGGNDGGGDDDDDYASDGENESGCSSEGRDRAASGSGGEPRTAAGPMPSGTVEVAFAVPPRGLGVRHKEGSFGDGAARNRATKARSVPWREIDKALAPPPAASVVDAGAHRRGSGTSAATTAAAAAAAEATTPMARFRFGAERGSGAWRLKRMRRLFSDRPWAPVDASQAASATASGGASRSTGGGGGGLALGGSEVTCGFTAGAGGVVLSSSSPLLVAMPPKARVKAFEGPRPTVALSLDVDGVLRWLPRAQAAKAFRPPDSSALCGGGGVGAGPMRVTLALTLGPGDLATALRAFEALTAAAAAAAGAEAEAAADDAEKSGAAPKAKAGGSASTAAAEALSTRAKLVAGAAKPSGDHGGGGGGGDDGGGDGGAELLGGFARLWGVAFALPEEGKVGKPPLRRVPPAVVLEVVPGSAADRAGVQAGWALSSVGAEPVGDAAEAEAALEAALRGAVAASVAAVASCAASEAAARSEAAAGRGASRATRGDRLHAGGGGPDGGGPDGDPFGRTAAVRRARSVAVVFRTRRPRDVVDDPSLLADGGGAEEEEEEEEEEKEEEDAHSEAHPNGCGALKLSGAVSVVCSAKDRTITVSSVVGDALQTLVVENDHFSEEQV